jgi:predicted membrane-bound spermidine synthase
MREVQRWGVTEYSSYDHKSFKTRRAAIDLISNPYYGRMLFIDGVLQSATSDERIYHGELIKNIADAKTVLIAGGAEGALAKQVLSGSVSKVVMVDWDEELVDAMRSEPFAGGAFEDPRLEIIHEDIVDYIKGAENFDYILLDLLDPDDDVDWLIGVCELCLKKTSSLCMNAGGNWETVKTIIHHLEKEGRYIIKRKINVPSFQQEWYLIEIDVYYT